MDGMDTAGVRIDKVIVSWYEEWDLPHYLDRYLSTRRLTGREHARESLRRCLDRYTGQAPFRKSDLDYFLDANYAK
jgi:hypothetical protein